MPTQGPHSQHSPEAGLHQLRLRDEARVGSARLRTRVGAAATGHCLPPGQPGREKLNLPACPDSRPGDRGPRAGGKPAGRARGCRPPAALGGAAPGTGCPAGSPRPCPPRGPGHSTGSSAPPLPHSSGCKRPACTATWGKRVSGGAPGDPASPHVHPRPERAWKRFSFRGVTFTSPLGGSAQWTENIQKTPLCRRGS